jgi:hypothetical protein
MFHEPICVEGGSRKRMLIKRRAQAESDRNTSKALSQVTKNRTGESGLCHIGLSSISVGRRPVAHRLKAG